MEVNQNLSRSISEKVGELPLNKISLVKYSDLDECTQKTALEAIAKINRKINTGGGKNWEECGYTSNICKRINVCSGAKNTLFLALDEEKQKVVGYSAFYTKADNVDGINQWLKSEKEAYCSWTGVNEKYRGRGISENLKLMIFDPEQRITMFTGHIKKTNQASLRVLAKFGEKGHEISKKELNDTYVYSVHKKSDLPPLIFERISKGGNQGLLRQEFITQCLQPLKESELIEVLRIVENECGPESSLLLEILATSAKDNYSCGLEFLKKREVLSLPFLELLITFARENPWHVLQMITDRYTTDCTPEEKRVFIEVAKIAAHLDLQEMSSQFESYVLSPQGDQQALLEIAKIAFQENSEETLYCLEGFGLDKQSLNELALWGAKLNPVAVLAHLKDFSLHLNSLEDRETINILLKHAATIDPEWIGCHLRNFGFHMGNPQDRAVFIEILQLAVLQNPSRLLHNLSEILDPSDPNEKQIFIKTLKSVALDDALLVLTLHGPNLMDYQKGCSFRDPNSEEDSKFVLDLLESAARKNGQQLFFHLKHLSGLDPLLPKDRKIIINLAKVALIGGAPPDFIPNIGGLSSKEVYHLFLVYLMNNPFDIRNPQNIQAAELFFKDLEKLGLEHTLACSDVKFFLGLASDFHDWNSVRNRFLEKACKYAEREALEKIIAEIDKSPTPNEPIHAIQRINALMWLAASLLFLQADERSAERFPLPATDLRIFSLILVFKDPVLRSRFSASLPSAMSDSAGWENFNTFCLSRPHNELFATLGLLLISNLQLTAEEILPIATVMKSRPFKYSVRRKLLITALERVASASQLTIEDRKYYIATMIQEKEWKELEKILNRTIAVFASERTENLTRNELDKGLVDHPLAEILEANLTSSFTRNFPVKWSKGAHERYIETFGQFRDQGALVSYLKKAPLKFSVPDRDAFKASLTDCVENVLKGTFQAWRYDTGHNAHLQKIYSYDPKIKEAWETGIEKTVQELTPDIRGAQACAGLLVFEGDDLCDIFHCGIEVAGSCQSVYDETGNNIGLMGYLANGQNRLICIKTSKTGKIQARALLRLLWLDQEQKPALFLERIYPANANQAAREALLNMANLKAVNMGLSLYKKESQESEESENAPNLTSFGGRAPFDYVDGINRATEGSYTIRRVEKIV